MRRWDRLLDSYVEEYRARGVCPQSVAYTEARLNRWGAVAQRATPTRRDRVHRCRDDYALHLELLKFSCQGDRVRDAEHPAGLR